MSHAPDVPGIAERRLRAIIPVIAHVIWTRSPEGGFVSEQPGWAAFTGQSFEEYRGWGWLDAIHPEGLCQPGGRAA